MSSKDRTHFFDEKIFDCCKSVIRSERKSGATYSYLSSSPSFEKDTCWQQLNTYQRLTLSIYIDGSLYPRGSLPLRRSTTPERTTGPVSASRLYGVSSSVYQPFAVILFTVSAVVRGLAALSCLSVPNGSRPTTSSCFLLWSYYALSISSSLLSFLAAKLPSGCQD